MKFCVYDRAAKEMLIFLTWSQTRLFDEQSHKAEIWRVN